MQAPLFPHAKCRWCCFLVLVLLCCPLSARSNNPAADTDEPCIRVEIIPMEEFLRLQANTPPQKSWELGVGGEPLPDCLDIAVPFTPTNIVIIDSYSDPAAEP